MLDKATGSSVMTKVLNQQAEEFRDGTTYISHGDSVFAYTTPMLSVLKWGIKANAPGPKQKDQL